MCGDLFSFVATDVGSSVVRADIVSGISPVDFECTIASVGSSDGDGGARGEDRLDSRTLILFGLYLTVVVRGTSVELRRVDGRCIHFADGSSSSGARSLVERFRGGLSSGVSRRSRCDESL